MPTPLPRVEVPDSEPTTERSYGIIPIRLIKNGIGTSTGNTQVLLIQQKPPMRAPHPPFWSFPKGHPEREDVSIIHTALRELHEETGLFAPENGILFKDTEGLMERYRVPIGGWVKEVRYWIALVEGTEGHTKIRFQQAEVVDAKWLGWEEAIELCTVGNYPKGKEILERVMRLLDRTGESNGVNGEGSTSSRSIVSGHL